MTISVYKVQSVLNSYLKQLKVVDSDKKKEGKKAAKDVVSISGEARKKHMKNKVGDDAVKTLHKWAMKDLKEKGSKKVDA